jgi:hypothetical protein
MANALRFVHAGGEADKLAKFIEMVNDLFDMANTRSSTEHVHKRNSNMKPYTDPNDQRLTWVTDVFLPYLDQWKTNVANRPGFTKDHQQTVGDCDEHSCDRK